MRKNSTIYIFKFTVYFLFFCLTACNTGIESTKAIKMSKSDKKDIMPTTEEIFAEKISSQVVGNWEIGKKFVVADEKAFIVLKNEPGSLASVPVGSELCYLGFETKDNAGGEEMCLLRFSDKTGKNIYVYNTNKKHEDCKKSFTGLDVPALIDLDVVDLTKQHLQSQSLWIKTQLWYDEEGNVKKGKKYVPVKILSVEPGNMYFPIKIRFTDSDAKDVSEILMNVRASNGIGVESRTFPSLFYLSDPKLKYPSITDENWALIQEGKVAIGMTKDECRLSLGSPSDVDSGHDWNNTLDLWRYKDGTFLQFQDGLLVKYRH